MDDQPIIDDQQDFTNPIATGGSLRYAAGTSPDFLFLTTRGLGKFLDKISVNLLRTSFNKVLLVDDNASVHVFVDRVLNASGYVLQHAHSGKEALAGIENNPPDFIVIDLETSDINGIEVCDAIRRTFKHKYIYIILVTSRGLVRDKVQAIASGADDYLVKPILAGELLSRLQAGTRILELQQQLQELATSDPLTGLSSRRMFFPMLEQEWNRALRNASPLSCVMIDIESFNTINEIHGHVHGDWVLTRIAAILKQSCRRSDIVCRFGGDEFCVILPDTPLEGAHYWSERCREAVEQERGLIREHDYFPTINLGAAETTGETTSPEMLLQKANEALSRAKSAGRRRSAAFDFSLPTIHKIPAPDFVL